MDEMTQLYTSYLKEKGNEQNAEGTYISGWSILNDIHGTGLFYTPP